MANRSFYQFATAIGTTSSIRITPRSGHGPGGPKFRVTSMHIRRPPALICLKTSSTGGAHLLATLSRLRCWLSASLLRIRGLSLRALPSPEHGSREGSALRHSPVHDGELSIHPQKSDSRGGQSSALLPGGDNRALGRNEGMRVWKRGASDEGRI